MITESLLIKIIGALAGAVLALVFIPPKTFTGFTRRMTASLIVGPIFSPVVHSYMLWPDKWEHHLAAAALTAFLSWWMLGVIINAVRKWLTAKVEGSSE
jgi:hypothetical protein